MEYSSECKVQLCQDVSLYEKQPAESSVNSVFFEEIRKFWLGFIMMVYEKYILQDL